MVIHMRLGLEMTVIKLNINFSISQKSTKLTEYSIFFSLSKLISDSFPIHASGIENDQRNWISKAGFCLFQIPALNESNKREHTPRSTILFRICQIVRISVGAIFAVSWIFSCVWIEKTKIWYFSTIQSNFSSNTVILVSN